MAACYRRCLAIASEKALRSVAFPAISTGIYGYPKAEAARIAIASVREASAGSGSLLEAIFCCFSAEDFRLYQQLLG